MANPIGNEIVYVQGLDNTGAPAAILEPFTVSQIAASTPGISSITAAASLTGTGNATIPAASLFKKIINRTGATANFTDTTDTATNIIATMGSTPTVGQTYQVTYDNNTTFTATLAGGAGVTISGVTIVPAGSYVRYLVTYTGAGAVSFFPSEGGTIGSSIQGAVANFNSGNTPLSLSVANITGSQDVNLNLTAVLAGAGTATLPTATALVSGIVNPIIGQGYNLRIINSSSGAFAWTVATAAGWTLTGTMTIAQNTFRDFVVTLNSATTATLTSVGTGTYS